MPKKTVKSKKTAKKTRVTKTASKATKKVKKTKKVAAPVVPAVPVVPVAPPAPPVKSEAEKIWEEIKHLTIQMFGLPDQIVAQHCTFIPVEPTALYLTIRSTATLPSLEAAIAPAFVVELVDKFVIVRRVPKPVIPSKR